MKVIYSLFLIFISCGSTGQLARSEYEANRGFSVNGDALEVKSERRHLEQESSGIERKVIYNASIILECEKPDSVLKLLADDARELKGYVLSSRQSIVQVRIPAKSLQASLKRISKYGEIKYKNIYGNDVTEEYFDLEIRIDNLIKARDRYLKLLEKANSVEETLKVERELERLRRDIELYKGRFKRLKHVTSYATIRITVEKKITLGPLGYILKGAYSLVKLLFVWDD